MKLALPTEQRLMGARNDCFIGPLTASAQKLVFACVPAAGRSVAMTSVITLGERSAFTLLALAGAILNHRDWYPA
jgi:hypothetical protein